MAKRSINIVFDYISPISSEQLAQRSFVNRLDLKDRLAGQVLRNALLIVSGYSSIGKTTLLNLAADRKHLQLVRFPFGRVITIQIANCPDGQILKAIYDDISEFTNIRRPDTLTPAFLARELIHNNRLLIIVDGIQNLYNQEASSRQLYSLCKAWTDIPDKGEPPKSKLVLVASGLSHLADQWIKVNQARSQTRLPYEHFSLPPWSLEDLMKIIDIGSRNLGVTFDKDLRMWMAKVSCGLPSTMTLLAHMTSRHANNDQDIVFKENLPVDRSDLRGLFAEKETFERVLYSNERIDVLSTSALIALYLLGVSGGKARPAMINHYLESHGFESQNGGDELADLVTVTQKGDTDLWSLNELSYGTFAFLRLYHRSNINVDDADQIKQVLDDLNNVNIDQLEPSSGFPEPFATQQGESKMLPPDQQAAWAILQQAFTFLAGELRQRWQLAREKKADNQASKETPPAGVSPELQNTLKSQIARMQDQVRLRMIIDDLETSIKMMEDYNRRRNKYRQQLPTAMDRTPIELQIEEAETQINRAAQEIKRIFEKLAQEEVTIENGSV